MEFHTGHNYRPSPCDIKKGPGRSLFQAFQYLPLCSLLVIYCILEGLSG